ncbi:MAG: acyltransferase [Opitutaceae bacterium]|nr:acyltransferase [Opitutaceae bacterium]
MIASPSCSTAPRSGVIDLWRALACLAVLTYHARCNYFEADIHPSVAFLNRIAEHGYLGVRIFFVLSGYCLAESLEQRFRRGGCSAISFWQDRFLRIFPVYWAALAGTILLALAALPFNGISLSSVARGDPLFWLANLSLSTEWLGFRPILLVSWSLDYEIGFYLLIGAALLLPRANTTTRLVCYTLITAVAHWPGAAEYCPLLLCWPAFACGVAVRFALDPEFPHPLRCSLASYPIVLLLFSSGDDLLTPVFAVMLLANLAFEKHLPAPPRILLQLGAAAYSIYLVHIPFAAVANLARRFIAPSSLAYLAVWWGQIVIGVAAGLLFFAAVERPCERLRARLHPRRIST